MNENFDNLMKKVDENKKQWEEIINLKNEIEINMSDFNESNKLMAKCLIKLVDRLTPMFSYNEDVSKELNKLTKLFKK